MANILLFDDSEVASRAMRGILARGQHQFAVVTESAAAWEFIREQVKIDLLFLEVKLRTENGIRLIERLRNDSMLKYLPVVVYSNVSDLLVVKTALGLKIQHYLIKPYHEEAIYAEIAKAGANPWRNLHFEEEKSFCTQLCIKPDELRKLRVDLMAAIEDTRQAFMAIPDEHQHPEVFERISALAEQAEAAGVWGVVDCLKALRGNLESGYWYMLRPAAADLGFAWRLIFCHLNPGHVPEGFISDQERKEMHEARERNRWFGTDVKASGPISTQKIVESQLDALPGCPVIDTVAAAFQMTADGRASSLHHVMDLVARDPGLSAQVLVAANRLDRDDMTPVEDPRLAVSLLGEIKLNSMARALPLVEERYLHIPPITWSNFWMFQVGVAQLAKYSAEHLEFRGLVANAFTAGLLHDLGKLLLLRIYPYAFQAIVAYARKETLALQEAEQRFIGCTTRTIGDHFARKNDLPKVYCSVIRWVETPEEATDDPEMVAVVSLARHFCLASHVGNCGDTPKDHYPPVAETAAWRVLQDSVFPGFDLKNFEAQAHAYCHELKQTPPGSAT
jgi:HD-like signal output (HDOD) protein/CheY-like chemotaxis protein